MRSVGPNGGICPPRPGSTRQLGLERLAVLEGALSELAAAGAAAQERLAADVQRGERGAAKDAHFRWGVVLSAVRHARTPTHAVMQSRRRQY